MKSHIVAIIITFVVCGQVFADQYTLTIDGKEYDINIGRQKIVKLADGRILRVTLNKKAIVSFKSDQFTFNYPSRLSPSRVEIDRGIYQTGMGTPTGVMVLVQEYMNLDPSGIIDMMLNELTKEEAHYGFEITKLETTKTLSDGTELTGKMAVSTYKEVETTKHVLCYPARDAGLIIITMFENDTPPEDRQIIDLFWKTLKVSLK